MKHTSGDPAATADMAPSQLNAQSDVWVRDLTEEGIEPHPGPRYLSKNVNSLLKKGKLYNYLKRIRDEHARSPITAVFIQDHRFPLAQEAAIEKVAKGLGLLAITAHSPPSPNNRVCYGGTMIVIPHSAIECEENESLHAACDRIKQTRKRAARGRYVSVEMKVNQRKRKLTAAYAPATGADRPAFFNAITPRLRKHTVLGIDANCVPDPTLDLKRDATSPYPNTGADILRDAVDEKGLTDVVREVLGSTPYFSSHHVVAGGACWSRIDQIYAPHASNEQYSVGDGDIFPRGGGSGVELDHTMVDIRSEVVRPKRGTDLPRINEAIFDDPAFLAKLHETITHMRSQIATAQPDGWRKGWEAIKVELKDLCLKQTKATKYRASWTVRRKRKMLKMIDKLIQSGTAHPA